MKASGCRGSRASAALALLCTLLLSLVACQSRETLEVAYHPFVGYETLPLARDLGWLPDTVVLRRVASAEDSMRALLDGSVQAAALTLDEAVRLRSQLPKLRVVLVMDESAGADMLLAREGITSIEALKGRRVAYQESSVSELLLRSALRSAGLEFGDITAVNLAAPAHVAAFAAGEVDAVASYPPATGAIEDMGAQRLFDSRELPGTILDVLVVNRGQVINREGALTELIAAHFRSLNHLRTNREDVIYRYAHYQDTSSDGVRRALAGVRLPALSAVRRYLAPGGAVENAAAAMLASGVVESRAIDTAPLSDASFLPREGP